MPKAEVLNHVLRGVQVARYLNCSLANVYRKVNAGLLPNPIQYGSQSVAWHTQELDVVVVAQAYGYTEDELKTLVQEIIDKRKSVKEDENE